MANKISTNRSDARSSREDQRTIPITSRFHGMSNHVRISDHANGRMSLAWRAKWFLPVLAAMLMLAAMPKVGHAQDPCANFSVAQVDPSTWAPWVLEALNCTPTAGSCSASSCSDCRYVGFANNGPCTLVQIAFNGNGACFSMCAVYGNPIIWEYWSNPNSTECDVLNKNLSPNNGVGLGPGGVLQMKVCGTFPMTFTVAVLDCVTNEPCYETITIN